MRGRDGPRTKTRGHDQVLRLGAKDQDQDLGPRLSLTFLASSASISSHRFMRRANSSRLRSSSSCASCRAWLCSRRRVNCDACDDTSSGVSEGEGCGMRGEGMEGGSGEGQVGMGGREGGGEGEGAGRWVVTGTDEALHTDGR